MASGASDRAMRAKIRGAQEREAKLANLLAAARYYVYEVSVGDAGDETVNSHCNGARLLLERIDKALA